MAAKPRALQLDVARIAIPPGAPSQSPAEQARILYTLTQADVAIYERRCRTTMERGIAAAQELLTAMSAGLAQQHPDETIGELALSYEAEAGRLLDALNVRQVVAAAHRHDACRMTAAMMQNPLFRRWPLDEGARRGDV